MPLRKEKEKSEMICSHQDQNDHLMCSSCCVQALSPVRFTELASLPESPQHTASLSPEDQRFLKGSHHVLLCPPPTVTGQQNFSESWPSTDQSSSPASTDVEHPQHTVTSRTQEPSVLAKYVDGLIGFD